MKNIKVIRRKLRTRFDDKQTVTDPISALQGLGSGVVDVPNQAGMVYIRVGNEENYGTAFNNRTPHTDDLSVLVGYDPVTDPARRLFQVLSISQTAYVDAGNQPIPFVGPHHSTHEWGGGDDTFIEWRRIMGLRVGRPALYVVTVDPGVIIRSGAHQYIPSTLVDLTAEQGALIGTQAQYILIYLDSVGAVQHLGGAVKASTAALAISDIPIAPGAGDYELGAVRLHANAPLYIGDTPSDPDIWDLRYPASAAWSSGAGWSLLGNAGTVAGTNFMGTTDNIDVVFKRNSVEAMRFDLSSAGTPRTRIGTPGNPAGLTTYSGLSLYGDNVINSEFHMIATGNGIYPTLSAWRAKGSVAGGLTAVVANDYIFSFSGKAHDGTAWSTSRVAMRFLANGNWAVGDHPTRISFYTTPVGSATIDEHARLSRGDFRVLYDATNYVAIQPASTCGALTWAPEISGAVIVRSATPNVVTGNLGVAGNARGDYAIDLQIRRLIATEVASGNYSIIGGGLKNTASNIHSTVCGGYLNTASGQYATIIGGDSNIASGQYATVIGGYINAASGDFSIAGGRRAKTGANAGVFIYGDSTNTDFNGIIADEFAIRARGGFRHAYDDTHYWTAQCASTGVTTFATLPVGAGFVFTPNVVFSDNVGIGMTPVYKLDITQSQNGVSRISLLNADSGASAQALIQLKNDAANAFQLGVKSSGAAVPNQGYFQMNAGPFVLRTIGANAITFETNSILRATIGAAGGLTVVDAFGCNGAAAQAAYASGGALNAYGAGANGLDTGANMAALHALVVAMRAALVANGIMS